MAVMEAAVDTQTGDVTARCRMYTDRLILLPFQNWDG